MTAPITIQDVFKLVLYLLGIGVLGYLLVMFKNLAEVFKTLSAIASENKKNVNETIGEIPKITKNITSITTTAEETLSSMAPEIDGIVHSTNNVTSRVESIADLLDDASIKVAGTVENVTDNINDTANKFSSNLDNIIYYMSIINEIIDIIKNAVFKR